MTDWRKELTERENKEVDFAFIYADLYNHGTDGHSRLTLIARLARLLDSGYGQPVAVKPFTDPKQSA